MDALLLGGTNIGYDSPMPSLIMIMEMEHRLPRLTLHNTPNVIGQLMMEGSPGITGY